MQEMNTNSYPAPVNTLLTLGRPEEFEAKDWPDYRTMGIGPEYIPDLIRLATDVALSKSDSERPETWAPIHAWRALGQLRAEAAVEPLLTIFDPMEGDEWVMEEMPEVMRKIGPVALSALKVFLADDSHEIYARITAATCVEYIGKQWPDSRTEAVTILTHQLESFAENVDDLNAFLIMSLVHLQARESLPVIEQAFAANRVDTSIIGDWDDVQVEFGMKSRAEVDKIHEQKRAERAERIATRPSESDSWLFPYPLPEKPKKDKSAKKTKNKMAKQSRKKNRRR